MKKNTVMIQNELGMHARAAAVFVKEANKFLSDITVIKDSTKVNGKSILDLLTVAAAKGSEIVITAKGKDEDMAVEALTKVVDGLFGEDR